MNTKELRELLSKATPRPWEERFIYRQLSLYSQSCFNPSIQKAWDDAALIVALVNNAEALLDKVERLRADNEQRRELSTDAVREMNKYTPQVVQEPQK